MGSRVGGPLSRSVWAAPAGPGCSPQPGFAISRLRARLGRSTKETFSLCPGSCSVLPSTLRLGWPKTRVAPGRPSPGSPARPSHGGCGDQGSSGPPRVWRKGPASSSSHPSPCPPSLSTECCWKPAPSEAPKGLFPNQDPHRHWDPLLQDTPPFARASSADPRPADMPTGTDHCWQPRPRTSLTPSELLQPLSRLPESRALPTLSQTHSGSCTPAPQGGQPLPGQPGSPHPHAPARPAGQTRPSWLPRPLEDLQALLPELGPPAAENKHLQKPYPTWLTAPSALPWACREEQTQTRPVLSGEGPGETSA